jgi:hypothetical protein
MSSEQEAAVRKVIQQYMDGTYKGEVDSLKACFHPGAVMNGFFSGKLLIGSPEPFFQEIAGNPSMTSANVPYTGEITSVEVFDKAASVTLKEKGFGGSINFTNFFHLLKIEDKWLITSKTFITE